MDVSNIYNSSPVNEIETIKIITKDDDYQKKSGVLWECVGEEDGGYLFRIKADYAHLTDYELQKVSLETYPALEPAKIAIEGVSPQNELDYIGYSRLKRLGYKFEMREGSAHMVLPKIDTLVSLWDKLVLSDFGHLPEDQRPKLEIYVSSGTLSDMEFTKKLTKEGYDIVVSDDKEFVHDHIIHVIPKLTQLLTDYQNYTRVKEFIGKQVSAIIDKIEAKSKQPLSVKEQEYLELIKLSLGVQIDALGSRYSFKEVEDGFLNDSKIEEILLNNWSTELLIPYLNERVEKIGPPPFEDFMVPNEMKFSFAALYSKGSRKLIEIHQERYQLLEFYRTLMKEDLPQVNGAAPSIITRIKNIFKANVR